jgi:hypothetical protein
MLESPIASALTFVGLTTVLSGLAAGSPGKASAVHDCKTILKTNNTTNFDTIGVFIINHLRIRNNILAMPSGRSGSIDFSEKKGSLSQSRF